jgi:hypothetical protein
MPSFGNPNSIKLDDGKNSAGHGARLGLNT